MTEPSPFLPVVIVPTFNHAATLGDVLRRVLAQGLPVIVIDDGSTDGTRSVLAEAQAQVQVQARGDQLHVIVHEHNRGKAAALATGFHAAMQRGQTHAVTIDADNQHDPEEIPRLLELAAAQPEALVLGTRSESISGYPSRSLAGRRISNFLVRFECGRQVSDSQSGYRVYPLMLIRKVPCRSGRYCFETEVLTRAAWAGFAFVECPISSRYFPPEQRVSHFQPWRDSLRSVGMHLRLLGRSLLRWGTWSAPRRQASAKAAADGA